MDSDAIQAEVLSQYSNHVNPSLAKLMNFAGFGVEVRGEGCFLYDQEGRKYFDCLGSYGVFTLGHRHPNVIAAVKKQLDIMPLSGKVFFNPIQAQLATLLAQLSPEGLEYCFFSNSGTEAVEAALKFALKTTGRTRFVSTIDGYHGKTLGALAVTGRDKYKIGLGELRPGTSFCKFGDSEAMERNINHDTAAVIIEVIQGEGGIHIAPKGYLTTIRKRCNEVGALMIVDEVQTGIGRTGKMFACEHEGITPDILTLAKALGGGVMPIGCTMGTKQVWDAVFSENPLMHTSTFGGNPLACCAGIATIETILSENLLERCVTIGEKLKSGLEKVAAQHQDLISEVRGMGLILGVEFSMDEVGELVIAQMTKRGVVAAYTLNNPRVIRFEPPLIANDSDIEMVCEVFGAAVSETAEILATLV